MLEKLLGCIPNNEKKYQRLKNTKNIIPFIGAGFTADIFNRDWRRMLLAMAEEPGYDCVEEVEELLSKYLYEEAASFLYEKYGEDDFNEKLIEEFDEAKVDDNLVQAGYRKEFAQIFSNGIITTNFDTVLERLYDVSSKPFEYILTPHSSGEQLLATDFARGDMHILVKLHGTIKNVRKLVLTKERYDECYGDSVDINRPLPDALKRFFMAKTILFIGCSLHQDRTMQLIQKMAKEGYRHYAFLELPEDTKNDEDPCSVQNVFIEGTRKFKLSVINRKKELDELGIIPIWYPYGHHEFIRYYLEGLRENNFLSDEYVIPRKLYEFFGREKELEELENWIGRKDDAISSNILVVNGEPGLGKTELCKELIRKMAQKNKLKTIYIDATEKKSLELFAEKIAETINLLGSKDFYSKDSQEIYYRYVFREFIAYLRSRKDYICVYLDNFEDLIRNINGDEEYVIVDFLQMLAQTTKVLISSCEFQYDIGKVYPLKPLDPMAAKKMFLYHYNGTFSLEKYIKNGQLDQLLANSFSCHPLTIIIAARQCKMYSSLEELEKSDLINVSLKLSGSRYNSLKGALTATWRIIARDRIACQMWGVISLYGTAIPLYVLEACFPAGNKYRKALDLLRELRIVSLNELTVEMLAPIRNICFEFDENLYGESASILLNALIELYAKANKDTSDECLDYKNGVQIILETVVVMKKLMEDNFENELVFKLHSELHNYYQYCVVESLALLLIFEDKCADIWDEGEVAELYELMGDMYGLLSDEKASACYEKALNILKKSGKDKDVAVVKGSLGGTIAANNSSEANRHLDEAIEILRRTVEDNPEDEGSLANVLHQKAELLFCSNENKKALKISEEVLAIYERRKNYIGVGNTYVLIGRILEKEKSYKNAIDNYMNAIQYYDLQKDNLGRGNASSGLARVYLKQGNRIAATKWFEKAKQYYDLTTDKRHYAWCTGFLGKINLEKGNEEEAELQFDEAFKTFLQLECYEECGECLHGLSKIIFKNKKNEAENILKRYKMILERTDNPQIKFQLQYTLYKDLVEYNIFSTSCKHLIKEVLPLRDLEMIFKFLEFQKSKVEQYDRSLNEETEENKIVQGQSFTILDSEGVQVEYDILFTFESTETGKNYIVYTDNAIDKENNIQVYASVINGRRLDAIETEYEWQIIETILEELQTNVRESSRDGKNKINTAKLLEKIESKLAELQKREKQEESISRRLDNAIQAYIQNDKVKAEQEFLKAYDEAMDTDRKHCLPTITNNLAYMKRRGETRRTRMSLSFLLKEETSVYTDAFRCVNRALCYVTGCEFEMSLTNAIKEILKIDEVENVVSWWNNREIVGTDESNLVLLLLEITGKIEKTDIAIQQRIKMAQGAGYDIPDEFEKLVCDIVRE